jgi:hypothetical protein
LGFKFKLFAVEVLFNKGLSEIYLGDEQGGISVMEQARRAKATAEHDVIDDAIRDRGQGYTVFSIPVGVLYRPSASKLKNVKTKDYLGKAKLIAAADSKDAFTTFTGVTRLNQGLTPSGESYADTGISGAALKRTATEPPPRVLKGDLDGRAPGANLARAQTTLNVPANRAERIAGATGGSSRSSPTNPTGPSLGRSNTTLNVPSNPAASLGSTPGLSVRKPPPSAAQRTQGERELASQIDRLALDDDRASAPSPPQLPPPSSAAAPGKGPRVTEFYDDYLDSYTDEVPEVPRMPAPAQGDRVAAWARENAGPRSTPPSRAQSTRAPPSSYSPSSFGSGGSMRRKLTRRGTARAPGSRAMSAYGYEDEEEGYGSGGEYDDVMYELVKIRVKLHYQDEVRGMALTPETPFEEFLAKVAAKFARGVNQISLKFRDEDGGKVTLRDESDYELAIETARESAKGKPEGKLEIWVQDL